MKIYDVRGIGASLTGSFSGSFKGLFTGPLDGVAATSSYVEYSNVANKPALVSGSSQVSFSGITNKPTLISGSAQIAALGYATTSTNVFQGNQTITGSLFISQNLVVAGSSSIQYITSSNLDIADNIITVNVLNPSVRYGGLGVIDSGSSPQRSGSLLFDSIKDEWIFVHQNQSVVTSSVLLMGPETYNNLGNETYLSANRLPKGSGVEHLRDSNITDTGTVVSINSNTRVTGSLNISGSLTVNGSGLVPYTGATQDVNLGVYSIATNSVLANQITVNPSGTTAAQVFLKHGSSFSLPNGFGSIGSSTGNEFRLYQVSSGGVWRGASISLNSITSSTTRTYTLPDSDGTIALASSLSSYLPLTGGTLTGTLNGTSVSFTGGFELNTAGTGALGFFGANNTTDKYIRIRNSSGNFEMGTSSTEHYLIGNGAIPLKFFTNGTLRLTLDGTTGAATFLSNDGSGNRTTVNDVLTITQTNPNSPYSGFGSGLLFRGTTYNGGGSGSPGVRNWGRIVMQLTDSSISTTGENMVFQVASADNSDTLTTALTLAYNGAATFSSSITTSGNINVNSDGIFINRSTSGEPYVFFRKDGVNRGAIYGVTGGGLRIFDESDNQILTITGAKVGIGTTSPSQKLDVHGNLRIRSSSSSVFTTSKYYSVSNNSTSDIFFDINSEFGIGNGGYVLVEITLSAYGNAGSGGGVYKWIAGGYSGHTIALTSYHKYEVIANTVSGNVSSISPYNPTYNVYGVTIVNSAAHVVVGVMEIRVTTTY